MSGMSSVMSGMSSMCATSGFSSLCGKSSMVGRVCYFRCYFGKGYGRSRFIRVRVWFAVVSPSRKVWTVFSVSSVVSSVSAISSVSICWI